MFSFLEEDYQNEKASRNQPDQGIKLQFATIMFATFLPSHYLIKKI